MRLKFHTLCLTLLFGLNHAHATPIHATEFDQYLQHKDIIDENFKIKNKKELNELLAGLSAEDSKTLPLQVDQNTVIEQLKMTANQTTLKGLITTPDFNQLEQDLGKKEIKQVILKNLLNNCNILFEHQYQKSNSYRAEIELSSDHDQYQFSINRKDCGI